MRELKSIHKSLIFTALIAIVVLFIGLVISFLSFKLLPGDPVLEVLAAMGIHSPTQPMIDAMEHQLGLDLPLFAQFFKYVGELLTGNWGHSVGVVAGAPVFDLIEVAIPKMIQVIFFPLIIGITLGIVLGTISSRYRNKWEDIVIQLFSYFIISIPVFSFGLFFRIFYSSPTGFGFIPVFVLSLANTALITLQTRSYLINKSNSGSIISFTSIVARSFGVVFMFYILIGETFGIIGFGGLLVDAFQQIDYFLILAMLFILIIIFILTIIISTLLFVSYRQLASKGYTKRITQLSKPKTDPRVDEVGNEETIKEYLLIRVKSPVFIIGMVLVLIYIILAIFPQIITQYSYDSLLGPHLGAWNPPSSDHPLGQTAMGSDVLGRCMYGIRDSLVFGAGAAMIGLVGGIPFGLVAGRFKHWGYKIIMAFMILFFVLPSICFVIIALVVYNGAYTIGMLSIGILLIPIFTRVIANAMPEEFNRKVISKIGKSLISYIPLAIALAILLYSSVDFLGFFQLVSIRLGDNINTAIANPYDAPWAWFWPGFTIFMIMLSFFIFHLGLKGLGSISRRRIKAIELE